MQFHPTVFLIDDDTDDQEIFCHAMEKANSQVQCVFANDGIMALDKIRHEEDFCPDFIFIDMNMPRMNGQQCLAEIKKIERMKNVPVYMYSTSVDPESIEENKQLGAADFIVKPSDLNDLITILRNIIQKPVLAVMFLLVSFGAFAQDSNGQDTLKPIRELKKLSVEELMNIVVTSVSKSPENLSEVASAIQVVTGYDIRRSTVTRLPEALRLASNLQVLQSGSHDWGVTARGFNGAPVANSSLANKLLVMIDGRTVYTPLFGGVYWDVQNFLLEDVDRIEVVSGPGGTLWGSNAVNGVVNIISRNASETQGLFASATYGSILRDHFALRYGGQVDSTLFFRLFGQRFDSENSLLADGTDARDSWNRTTGGFRMDYMPNANQSFTLQGDIYAGEEDDTLSTLVNGQNILGRWVMNSSETSRTLIQAYFDRTWRDIRTNSPLTDELLTFDLEGQQQFAVGKNNVFLIGAGYRIQEDHTGPNRFIPNDRTLTLISGFFQDHIHIIPEKLSITIGSKFLHNNYTGFEIQPSARVAWTPDLIHTIWGAVSRNVRTPSRFEMDLAPLDFSDFPEFVSEKLMAYELGYRMRPLSKVSISLATFYNQYYDLRTFNMTGDSFPAFYFANDMDANSWGFEISGTVLISNWWRIRGGCTFLDKEFIFNSDNIIDGSELLEAIDPKGELLFQSVMDISKSFELDVVTRVISKIPAVPLTNIPEVPSYVNMNVRLGWIYKFITISIAGQNLLYPSRTEFGTRQIQRNIYTNIKIRL
jgi:iron complex outermembrane recepter protein